MGANQSVFIAEALERSNGLDCWDVELMNVVEIACDSHTDGYRQDRCKANVPAVRHRLTLPTEAPRRRKRLRSAEWCDLHIQVKVKKLAKGAKRFASTAYCLHHLTRIASYNDELITNLEAS